MTCDEPYYDANGITLYHGDSRGFTVDAAITITDPPYGIAFDTDMTRFGAARNRTWDAIEGDTEPFDPARFLNGRCILFGANYYADRLPVGQWIVWNKRDAVEGGGVLADAEMAWHNCGGRPVRVFNWFWNGAYRKGESAPAKPRPALHPSQKPVALMQWLVEEFTQPGDLVFDPYMGSGPIAEACSKLGRRYVGVEIEEQYCEAAVSRLAQQSFDLEAA